jgi:putative flippase GtrA
MRAVKFGIAGIVGFLVLEVIIVLGVFIIYGKLIVPSEEYSSAALIELNVLAVLISVTVGFFVNEKTTVRNEGEQRSKGAKNLIVRLLKFQLAYALGNAITIGVQLALLASFGVTPVLGSIAGAIAAYPASYFIAMRYVWKVELLSRKGSAKVAEDRNSDKNSKDSNPLSLG